MRYLHPVTMKERFIASGTYTHYKDDVPTGSVEQWSIHELPDGAQFLRVDDDWRELDGSSVLLEGWRSPPAEGGRLERVDIAAFGPKDSEIKKVRATYTVLEDYLEVGRTVDDADRENMAVELPFGYVFAPESLLFAGSEVEHLALNPGKDVPVVSYIPTFLNASLAFRPTIFYQSAIFEADETIMLGKTAYQVRRYRQTDPRTQTASTIWLDEHDMLLQFKSADAQHHAILTEYSRRPIG